MPFTGFTIYLNEARGLLPAVHYGIAPCSPWLESGQGSVWKLKRVLSSAHRRHPSWQIMQALIMHVLWAPSTWLALGRIWIHKGPLPLLGSLSLASPWQASDVPLAFVSFTPSWEGGGDAQLGSAKLLLYWVCIWVGVAVSTKATHSWGQMGCHSQ